MSNISKARTPATQTKKPAAAPTTAAAQAKQIETKKLQEAQRKKSLPNQTVAQGLPFTAKTSRDPARLQQDKNIANSVSNEIEQCNDGVRPLMQEANSLIAEEERKDPKERNEDELVKRVTPLIQQAGELLQKCNSGIRSLDPAGQLRMRAQGDEALPEERKAAKLLSEMTGETVRSVQEAKKKLESMPKAAKGINPLWKMVGMPLVQVRPAVCSFCFGIVLTGHRLLEVKLP